MMDFETMDTTIRTLGEAKIPSPIRIGGVDADEIHFISDDDKVLVDINPTRLSAAFAKGDEPPSLEIAGPRKKIYFDPSKLRCALVTCGGLCPGLNDVIRAVVLQLYYGYDVRNICGIRHGLQGFIPKYGYNLLDLNPNAVSDILGLGGSVLGSSRGPQSVDEIVDSLERMSIGLLFMIGGDGTLKAATRVADAILERGLKICVIGIPKTIDNDIFMVSRSFGFDTAVDEATRAIRGAHNEAKGYPNGIGLIKLMGRDSGFIAATAALAQQDVNFVLVPELEFDLEGPHGLLRSLENRLEHRGHAVVVVAEGAGQSFFKNMGKGRDESGNIRLKDIGLFLKAKIKIYFEQKGIETTLKYIDPSYLIRSRPANADDSVFCGFLGRGAVHAGMAGKTKLLIGHWNNHFVHMPMDISVDRRKQINPGDILWRTVLEATGQGRLKNG